MSDEKDRFEGSVNLNQVSQYSNTNQNNSKYAQNSILKQNEIGQEKKNLPEDIEEDRDGDLDSNEDKKLSHMPSFENHENNLNSLHENISSAEQFKPLQEINKIEPSKEEQNLNKLSLEYNNNGEMISSKKEIKNIDNNDDSDVNNENAGMNNGNDNKITGNNNMDSNIQSNLNINNELNNKINNPDNNGNMYGNNINIMSENNIIQGNTNNNKNSQNNNNIIMNKGDDTIKSNASSYCLFIDTKIKFNNQEKSHDKQNQNNMEVQNNQINNQISNPISNNNQNENIYQNNQINNQNSIPISNKNQNENI